jgi:hypothetical protein
VRLRAAEATQDLHEIASWGLTFDMSGGTKGAKRL